MSARRDATGGGLRAAWYASPLYRLALSGAVPEAPIARPVDILPGDPARGAQLVDGQFSFAGEEVRAPGASIWQSPGGGPAWQDEFESFSWLRDLRASANAPARSRARELVESWFARHRDPDPRTWRPDRMGQRLTAWLTQAEFLLKDAEAEFTRTFMSGLARQARHLANTVGRAPDGARKLAAIRGLIDSGLCLPQGEKRAEQGLRLLDAELGRQVLNDGGHIERCPTTQLRVLRDLVELRQTLLALHRAPSAALLGTIDSMAPLLRSFRHGDGHLALFHGGVEEESWLIDLVLTQSEAKGRPLAAAPHSGFQWIQAGRALVLADVGAPPVAGGRGHAGTLSFEMSLGKERLIVNCGAYLGRNGEWREAMRATAAHSTLAVDERNSAELIEGGGIGRGPRQVSAERKEAEGNAWIEASHDGYLPTAGVVHHRRLYVDAEGTDLRGEDRLVRGGGRGKGEHRFAVRFHLHPDVQSSLVKDGSAVLLRLKSGAGWQMCAAGGRLSLTESVYLGVPGQRRRTEQIVVDGPIEGDETVVKWAFRRIPEG